MIRARDLNKEIKTLEDKGDTAKLADVVKAMCLVAKVVRDIKANQVLSLRAKGVELIKPDVVGKPETTKE